MNQNVDQLLIDLGKFLGAKMAPKSNKNRRQKNKKLIPVWTDFSLIFRRFWSPSWPPTGGGRRGVEHTFGVIVGSLGQDGPKTPPRDPPGPILEQF